MLLECGCTICNLICKCIVDVMSVMHLLQYTAWPATSLHISLCRRCWPIPQPNQGRCSYCAPGTAALNPDIPSPQPSPGLCAGAAGLSEGQCSCCLFPAHAQDPNPSPNPRLSPSLSRSCWPSPRLSQGHCSHCLTLLKSGWRCCRARCWGW